MLRSSPFLKSTSLIILAAILVGYASQFLPPTRQSALMPVQPEICVKDAVARDISGCPPDGYRQTQKRGTPFAYKDVTITLDKTLGAPQQTSKSTHFGFAAFGTTCLAWVIVFSAGWWGYRKVSTHQFPDRT